MNTTDPKVTSIDQNDQLKQAAETIKNIGESMRSMNEMLTKIQDSMTKIKQNMSRLSGFADVNTVLSRLDAINLDKK